MLLTGTLMPSEARAGEYSLGHGDLRIHFTGTQLYQMIHLDSLSIMDGVEAGNSPFGVDYNPREVSILVPEPTVSRPNGPEWAFIGNGPGDPTWFIPEVQEFDRPWLGVSTESLISSQWSDFKISLVGMSGPPSGHFSLSDSGGAFFSRTFFATVDGITAADSFSPILQSHAHSSWFFTQPGDYDIAIQVSGIHNTAGAVSSTASYRFSVVPEPGSAALLLLGSMMLCRRRNINTRPS